MMDLHRMSADPNPRTILRKDEVLRRTGLKTTGLYERIKKGEFPAQVSIGARAVGWYEDAVQSWIDSRPATVAWVGQNGHGPHGARSDKVLEHRPQGGHKELAAPPVSGRDNEPKEMPKRKPARRSSSDAPTGRRNAIAATSDARETEELKQLKAENSRLKILIANLMLENDALRSATAGFTAA